jgi:hypothetical protein
MADMEEDIAAELDEDQLPPEEKEKRVSVYEAIVSDIFARHYQPGGVEFAFERDEIAATAVRLSLKVPKNLGDVIYSYRYRRDLPQTILATQPSGLHWLILGAGDARYRFRLSKLRSVQPTKGLLVRKIPDATPEIISAYALSDEQALLAKVRYNRLIDIFLGIAANSLQNHLRTKIANYGQIEIDELYVGVDSRGAQYIVPVQAKGGNDRLGVIQTIQDVTFCTTQERYRHCIPRAVSAQFMGEDIAMFELLFDGNEVAIVQEKHYRLVPSSLIGAEDLTRYKSTN